MPLISVQRRSSGDPEAARSHLAAAVPHAGRIGHRQIGPLELARSLDCEYSGAPQEALAALTAAFASHTQDLGEIEDLLGDAVRLAIQAGDHETAKALTGHADALATGSDIAHRQANALYCHALLNLDAPRLLIAADRYGTAGRPLRQAMALEAASRHFADSGEKTRARAAFTAAEDIYTSLGATADITRLQAEFRTATSGTGHAQTPARIHS